MIVDNRLAREVLSEHKIEMDPTDSRSAEEYVLQLLVLIEELQKNDIRNEQNLRSESAQSDVPYFA
ncbi:MAG: hypothetical protein H6793_04130 [Candidatus Nomurabacteria bacterium]|nr:hypothetical protein [Candidatus Saccharibacteria bacterium]USN95484.1 MAG: hypothetical protein H6793_04130 [Candidatus Nomurabacteria bacterium]